MKVFLVVSALLLLYCTIAEENGAVQSESEAITGDDLADAEADLDMQARNDMPGADTDEQDGHDDALETLKRLLRRGKKEISLGSFWPACKTKWQYCVPAEYLKTRDNQDLLVKAIKNHCCEGLYCKPDKYGFYCYPNLV